MSYDVILSRDSFLLSVELRIFWAIAFIYGASLLLHVVHIASRGALAGRAAYLLLWAAAVPHAGLIIYRTFEAGRAPFQTLYESLSWFACSAVLTWLFVSRKWRGFYLPGALVSVLALGASLYDLLPRSQARSLPIPAPHLRHILGGCLGKRGVGQVLELGPQGDLVTHHVDGIRRLPSFKDSAFSQGHARVCLQHTRLHLHAHDLPGRKLARQAPRHTEPAHISGIGYDGADGYQTYRLIRGMDAGPRLVLQKALFHRDIRLFAMPPRRLLYRRDHIPAGRRL